MSKELLERLDGAGGIGLDLSPGDPICAEAASCIRGLVAALRERANTDDYLPGGVLAEYE
jgi:hypothetical protein